MADELEPRAMTDEERAFYELGTDDPVEDAPDSDDTGDDRPGFANRFRRTPDHLVRRTAAWRRLAKRTVEAHVARHGWTCPGWHLEPHPVRPGELAADHKLPLVLGGEPLPARPGVLCASCNARKGLSAAAVRWESSAEHRTPDDQACPARLGTLTGTDSSYWRGMLPWTASDATGSSPSTMNVGRQDDRSSREQRWAPRCRRFWNVAAWSAIYGSRAARWAATTGVPMQRDLVERAMAGDRDAFTELQRATIDKLYAIARLILRDSDRAQDATQEAYIAAWRRLSGLRDPDRFEPWLRRLLVNACYQEARSATRRTRIEGRVWPIGGGSPDPATLSADRDQLARAFKALAPEQRALIVMHYHLGLPMDETALILGMPVGTVKSRLHRTKQQMRATLEADARLPLPAGGAS